MKKLFILVMILTLSSCMVSQKSFDKKCCELEAQIGDLSEVIDSQQTEYRLKEQLLREQVNNLWKEVEKVEK